VQICDVCNKQIKLRNTQSCIWRKTCECPDLSSFEPTERASIIIPSRYPDIFEPCKNSVDRFCPKEKKILVRDGNAINPPNNWITVQAPDNFVYSRNINLGIEQSSGDVFLMNDDVQFTHSHTLEIMQGLLNSHPEIGILSPQIEGDVGCYAQGHVKNTIEYTTVRLCFVAVLIRREVIDKVGLLDENIGANRGYGYDDVDFCRRVVNAGYKMAATSRAVVRHGDGKEHRSRSFNRESHSFDSMDKISAAQYFKKWGDYNIEFK
jgi:GT2 family glycosyltransferase